MADFIFRVDSVHLSEAQQEKIATAIQGAVLTELARLDLHGEGKTKAAAVAGTGTFLYRPPGWYGGYLAKAIDAGTVMNTKLVATANVERNQSAA